MNSQETLNLTYNETMNETFDTGVAMVLGVNTSVCIVGTITNTTAFLVFNKSRPGSTMINMLLFLSVAEIFLSITAGVTALFQLVGMWQLHLQLQRSYIQNIIHSIFSDAHFTGLTVRNLWVAFIAFKRWDAIARPLRPLIRGCSKSHFAQILLVMYIVCGVMVCLIYTGLVPESQCGGLMFYFWYMMVSNCLTFALIAIFGILTVINSGSMTRYTGSDSMRPSLRKRQRAVTKTIVTLLATFLVCEVTFFCIHTIHYRGMCSNDRVNYSMISPVSFYIGYMLTDVDSICNFIIYCFCYASFRRHLRYCSSCRGVKDSPTVSQSINMRSSVVIVKAKQVSVELKD